MNEQHRVPSSLSREGEMQALRRAQQDARDIAARTGTPLVIYHDGKIEKRFVSGAVAVAAEQVEPPITSES